MPYNPPPFEAQAARPNPLEALRQANAKESYDWLSVNSPDHFEAVTYAVEQGVTPEEVYRTVYRDCFRHELAHRCRLAARWLAAQVAG